MISLKTGQAGAGVSKGSFSIGQTFFPLIYFSGQNWQQSRRRQKGQRGAAEQEAGRMRMVSLGRRRRSRKSRRSRVRSSRPSLHSSSVAPSRLPPTINLFEIQLSSFITTFKIFMYPSWQGGIDILRIDGHHWVQQKHQKLTIILIALSLSL